MRMLTAGNTDAECVWSTTSCNVFIATVKELGGHFSAVFKLVHSKIVSYFLGVARFVGALSDVFIEEGIMGVIKSVGRSLASVLSVLGGGKGKSGSRGRASSRRAR